MITSTITGALAIIAVFCLAFFAFLAIGASMLVLNNLYSRWMYLPRKEKVFWVIVLPVFLFISYWLGYFLEP